MHTDEMGVGSKHLHPQPPSDSCQIEVEVRTEQFQPLKTSLSYRTSCQERIEPILPVPVGYSSIFDRILLSTSILKTFITLHFASLVLLHS
jgi:hypothetical protein